MERFNTLEEYLKIFIERGKFKENVLVSYSLLSQAIIDYFADIDRLKNFHHIQKINFLKVHAYTAYWILRRKPIQITKESDDTELAFVNENFVASYLVQFLRGDNKGVVIKKADRLEYDEFIENLKYVLRYRMVTPQTLETFLQSYIAGRIFERSIGMDEEV